MLNYGFENLLITLEMAEVVTQLTRNSYRSKFILLTQLACYFFPPLNTELLEPKHRLIYSFRSDKKYRAIFICLPEDKVEIIAVTKHYRLLHFGDILKVARRRYRQFVKNGTDQGRRPEFQEGGLIRSAGGNKGGPLGRKKQERENGDERILGSGDFVERVLERADELEQKITNNLTLDASFQKVSIEMGMESKELLSSSRRVKVSKARSIVSYLAVREMGYRRVEIGRLLNRSGPGVSKCVERGKKIVDDDQSLRYKLIC
ncbi:MAG: hypothetical protein DRH12_12295 [Deltaproteobacteria bacterium]|nr:MAG: hypothetical protein DRH12_12295 [Deltaproteobacteria bacterium]